MQCSRPLRRVIDGETVYFPCGYCNVCLKNKRTEKALRAFLESKETEFSSFLTLTYSDENLPFTKDGLATLSRSQFDNFMKRLRSYYYEKGVKIRFLASGEYSPKLRPHYHICCFGLSVNDFLSRCNHYHQNSHGIVCEDFQGWKYGGILLQPFSFETAFYVSKYIVKQNRKEEFKKLGLEPEFVSQSRRPGLGYEYAFRNKQKLYTDGFIRCNGKKYKIPRYFISKILDESEQDELKARLELRVFENNKKFWQTHHTDQQKYFYMKEYGEQQEIHLSKGEKN